MGILVDGSSKNVQVGGVIPLGNVAAANLQNGIEVTDKVSGFITFNTFGGLLAFKGAAPNRQNGILITSTGGNNLVRTNVFSGNRRNGIKLAGKARGVTVDPNVVGGRPLARPRAAQRRQWPQDKQRSPRQRDLGRTRRSVIPQSLYSAILSASASHHGARTPQPGHLQLHRHQRSWWRRRCPIRREACSSAAVPARMWLA